MNILITGGNGYIAKSLSDGLWRGMNRYHITSITRNDFDLTDREATNKWFEDKYFDVVIHTAVVGGSRLHNDNADVLYQNLQMFFNLYNNSHHFKKLINFGSGAELGTPNDPYGLSKKVISKFIDAEPFFYNIRIYGVLMKMNGIQDLSNLTLNVILIKNILAYIKINQWISFIWGI